MNKILVALMIILSGTFIYLSMPTGIGVEEVLQSYNIQTVNSKSSFESKRVFELQYSKELAQKQNNPYGSTPVQGTGEIKSFSYPTIGPPVVLYLQGDPQWKDHPITSSKRIGPSGCGYTSLAMVSSYFTNTEITPPMIADMCGGRYHSSNGIQYSAFPFILNQYGLNVKQVQSNDAALELTDSGWEEVDKALDAGGLVIVSVKPGIFTTGGHIMVLRGRNLAGEYLVNNPSDNPVKNHFNMSFSRGDMKQNVKRAWTVLK